MLTLCHVTTVCKWDQYIRDVFNHTALSSKVSFRFISCTKAFRNWALMFGLNKRRCFFNTLDTLRFKECIILYILHCPVIYQLRLFHLWICRIWDCTSAFLGACHTWHISWKDLGVSPGPNEVYIVSFQGRWLSLYMYLQIYIYTDVFPLGGKEGEWTIMVSPALQQAKATKEVHSWGKLLDEDREEPLAAISAPAVCPKGGGSGPSQSIAPWHIKPFALYNMRWQVMEYLEASLELTKRKKNILTSTISWSGNSMEFL